MVLAVVTATIGCFQLGVGPLHRFDIRASMARTRVMRYETAGVDYKSLQ